MMENVNIVLDDGVDAVECRTRLEGAGLQVRSVLPELGAVVGVIESGSLAALRAVDGVLAVERESIVSVPPEPGGATDDSARGDVSVPGGEVS